jgi:hypothetical protein
MDADNVAAVFVVNDFAADLHGGNEILVYDRVDQQPGTHGVGGQEQIIAIEELLRNLRIEHIRLQARGGLVFTRTGLFQCWGETPIGTSPHVNHRASELERPQCNCPSAGAVSLTLAAGN